MKTTSTSPSDNGDFRLIPCWDKHNKTNRYALVDAKDYDRIMAFGEKRGGWKAWWKESSQTWYARCFETVNGKPRTYLMHREVLRLKYGDPREGDHIFHNGLDNRRQNLRITTKYGNQKNRKKGKRSKYGTGITRNKNGTYTAKIGVNGKSVYLGCHKTRKKAVAARKAYERKEGIFDGPEEEAFRNSED